jgi:hypothetical protein
MDKSEYSERNLFHIEHLSRFSPDKFIAPAIEVQNSNESRRNGGTNVLYQSKKHWDMQEKMHLLEEKSLNKYIKN